MSDTAWSKDRGVAPTKVVGCMSSLFPDLKWP